LFVAGFALPAWSARGAPPEVPSTASDGAAQVPVVPDLPTALRQQLRLALVPRKTAFDIVIVDAVEKLPTEN
jgi:uncharacterized protein (TIGR03435 family)